MTAGSGEVGGSNLPGVAEARPLPPGLRRPILTLDDIGGIIVVEPPIFPPEPQPLPPVGVRVAVRGGDVLREDTIAAENASQTFFDVPRPVPSHDIVDVTFTNRNDFPILVKAFIEVRNELEVETTGVPVDLLHRLFRDSLIWLAPTISVRDGSLQFSFSEEARGTLGMDPLRVDLGFDFDAGVTIAPKGDGIVLMSQELAIRRQADAVRAFIRRSPAGGGVGLPSDFSTQCVDAYFLGRTLPDAVNIEASGQIGRALVALAFARHPILGTNPLLRGRRDDLAIEIGYRLTELRAGNKTLELNIDTITADLLVVFRNTVRPEPHPSDHLPDDFIPGAYLMPRFDLQVDVSDIDVEVDFDLPGGPLTKPFEWMGEQVAEGALEALVEFLEDDLEELARDLGMGYLEDMAPRIAEGFTSTARRIANRDHVVRRVTFGAQRLNIVTFDPAQLDVPYVVPDLIDHRFDDINVTVTTAPPIDGPMEPMSAQRLANIDHLVFVMMENRSFDHMLGYLSHPSFRGRTEVEGLNGREISLGGDFVGTVATPQPSVRDKFRPDPGHGFGTVARQIADGAMNGFVSEFARRLDDRSDEINPSGNLNDPERVLGFHTPEQLPTYDDLTRNHAVLDHWFCSIPGGTYPNRLCYYAGITPFLNNSDVFEDAGYLTDLTVFDVLDHQGVEWAVFESSISFLRMFDAYRLNTQRVRPIDEFWNRPRSQSLPPVTFIDPNFYGTPADYESDDDHPPASAAKGQQFIKDVIDKLRGLNGWGRTMLLITYDEHGGFADHVPPPGTIASGFPPNPDGSSSVPLAHPDARSFGVRVPAFVVSPRVRGGSIESHIYDHATVFRTIIERFMPDLRSSAIIPERVRQARHLGETLIRSPLVSGGPDAVLTDAELMVGPGRRESPLSTGPADIAALRANRLATERNTRPEAVVRSDTDDYRPHLAAPPDREDFHHFLRQLGNPFRRH